MLTRTRRFCIGVLLLCGALASAATAPAPLLTCQGKLAESGVPVTGSRSFIFSLIMPDDTVGWTSPTLTLAVANGLYATLLGDTAVVGMTEIPSSLLTTPGLRLRVQSGAVVLSPDVAVVPALQANVAFAIADGAVTASSFAPGAITDAAVTSVAWTKVTGTPTTVDGYGITNAVKIGAGGPATIASGSVAPSGGMPGDLYVRSDTKAIFANVAGAWTRISETSGVRVVAAPSGAVVIQATDAHGSVIALCGPLSAASAQVPITFPAANAFPAGAVVRLRFHKTSLSSPACRYVLQSGDSLTLDATIYNLPSGSPALISSSNVLPHAAAFASDGVANWYLVP